MFLLGTASGEGREKGTGRDAETAERPLCAHTCFPSKSTSKGDEGLNTRKHSHVHMHAHTQKHTHTVSTWGKMVDTGRKHDWTRKKALQTTVISTHCVGTDSISVYFLHRAIPAGPGSLISPLFPLMIYYSCVHIHKIHTHIHLQA